MTLKHLRIFIIVYQMMNITRAAERLYMTQPAVTRAIREIEQYYGIKLFERINHRLYQTESGKEFYAHALHIIDSFDNLEKKLKNWDEIGVLRVGGSITIGNFILPPLVSEFQKCHPQMRLRVRISNSAQLQQGLLNNQLDLALIEGAVQSEYLETELLTEDTLVLILPPGHLLLSVAKIRLEDLMVYPFLMREEGSAGRTFLDHIFAAHGLELSPIWESVSTQAIVKAVAAGIGISILPEQLVRGAVKAGLVQTHIVEDEPFVRKNYMVWHKQKYLTVSVKEFMEQCRNLFAL